MMYGTLWPRINRGSHARQECPWTSSCSVKYAPRLTGVCFIRPVAVRGLCSQTAFHHSVLLRNRGLAQGGKSCFLCPSSAHVPRTRSVWPRTGCTQGKPLEVLCLEKWHLILTKGPCQRILLSEGNEFCIVPWNCFLLIN